MESLGLTGPFVHRIDPVIFQIGPVKIWFYGLAYALGFLGVHVWFRQNRHQLGWTVGDVYDFSIVAAVSCLLVGHLFEILVYEWELYVTDPIEILRYWHGGMATHGVLLGGTLSIAFAAYFKKRSFLEIADIVVIPTAFCMGLGRVGNFINGENFGPVTDAWWGVQFPYAEGFRHPVDLYDGSKNFLVLLILLAVRRQASTPGVLLGHFLFWYGFLRFGIDFFREYGSELLGVPKGQFFNLGMASAGLLVLLWCRRRKARLRDIDGKFPPPERSPARGFLAKQLLFVSLLVFSLTIPSGWSQRWLERLRLSNEAQSPASAVEPGAASPPLSILLPYNMSEMKPQV